MIAETYSSTKPERVSTERFGKFTNVWLRDNIVEDTADDGQNGSYTFWKCDEVFFSFAGAMSEQYAEEHFYDLWSVHEDDGKSAIDIAIEAKEDATKPDTQIQAIARMQVMSMDLSAESSSTIAEFRDYWPTWVPEHEYKKNDPVQWSGKHYRVSQPHTSSNVYPPDTAGESMYYPVEIASDGVIVYRTCHGDYDMVMEDETRHYPGPDGPVYRAKKDTSFGPDTMPDDWELV